MFLNLFSVVESILKGENVGITPRRSRSGQVANSVSSANNSGNGQQVKRLPHSVSEILFIRFLIKRLILMLSTASCLNGMSLVAFLLSTQVVVEKKFRVSKLTWTFQTRHINRTWDLFYTL